MAPLYSILDHVHRCCCGRLLRHDAKAGRVIVRCSACGEEAVAADGEAAVRDLCWCGIADVPRVKFHCIKNPQRSPEANDEICATEVAP